METKNIIEKHAKIISRRLIENYDRLGLRATGAYADEMEIKVTNTMMAIYSANHAYQMENGRRPGKRPPIPSIMRWMDAKKGVQFPSDQRERRRIAWAIATKIAKEGIKVPNNYNKGKVISSVVDEFLRNDVQDLIDDIALLARQEITSNVLTILRAA